MKLIITTIAVTIGMAMAQPDASTYITCQACHGADGKGLQLGPNLKMAPSLIGSELVTGKPELLALIILKGIQKEGAAYAGLMAGMEAMFTDDQKLADVMTYVRTGFGNTAEPVTAEQAKSYREQWADIKAPVTRAKLSELAK